ncbi:MAG: hypothetical protein HC929_02870 [Leptolyngbyaceae cyanobacterium SM2_5_2]|nr:hypothetical protein [Leptolyngbyaceae cyanobacterium SM2_5_2]
MDTHALKFNHPPQQRINEASQDPITAGEVDPQECLKNSIAARNLITKLAQALSRRSAKKDAPRVMKARDNDDQLCWQVYDPYEQKSHWFDSELDIMTWLDNRRFR